MARLVLHYDRMVEDALRGVLRDALTLCQKDGLPGDHHFYITFRTAFPGVDLAESIRARYPDEMTIVLQHQYWGLEVTKDWFEVTLSFNRINERLHIPFAAVTAFADPAAKFGLQFQVDVPEGTESSVESLPERPAAVPVDKDDAAAEPADKAAADKPAAEPPSAGGAQVIALDAFRKK